MDFARSYYSKNWWQMDNQGNGIKPKIVAVEDKELSGAMVDWANPWGPKRMPPSTISQERENNK